MSLPVLHIGLVNNMPDGALKATEHQFRSLLNAAAARHVDVRLSLFALQDVPRSQAGLGHVHEHYASLDQLWDAKLDGLIVTGAEPRAAKLSDEPYWRSLTQVFDWADQNVSSTMCSCLAAHAAVQHWDGVARRRLQDKCCGVFECTKISGHFLLAGLPAPILAPHSRWNDLPEPDLTSRGYRILTRTVDGSVDSFVRCRKSLFVFFQGHPEYEAATLLMEYRRDLGRYLRGERNDPPGLPQGYLDKAAEKMLTELHIRASRKRSEDLLAQFPWAVLANRVVNVWRPMATAIYSNWLAFQLARKNQITRFTVRRHSALSRSSASL
jgi:homoserine O-succinyltransferase/O-acetyltransferase